MSQSGPGRREVAYRLFAAEFDDSELSYSESDEERAPNYVVTPTGARVNRLFAVGVLTEVEAVNPEMVRGRVVDPTGAFVTYAGQYQPDALAFLERAEPPTFLALSGKARTYEPEDGDRIYTSVRPEAVSEVDAETRDRWVVTAAERTVERIGITASAIDSDLSGDRLQTALSEAGVDDRLAEGVTLALEHYGTTPAYLEALRKLAIDAVRVVADERDEVGRLELAPSEGDGDAEALATLELSSPIEEVPDDETGATAEPTVGEVEAEPDVGTTEDETTKIAETDTKGREDTDAETDAGMDETIAGSGLPDEPEPDAGVSSEEDTEPASETEATTAPEADTESGKPEPADPGSVKAEPTEPTVGEDEETAADSEPIDAESTASSEETESVGEGSEDFDPGEFELDEEERQAVEEEYGTEFSTAGEVEPADIEPEEPAGAVGESGDVASDDESGTADAESTSETPTPEPEPTAAEASEESSGGGEAVDLTDAVMETMERLDDGDGADRDTIVSTVADERGVASADVEEAIQEALMSGRCYEPTDGTLKSI